MCLIQERQIPVDYSFSDTFYLHFRKHLSLLILQVNFNYVCPSASEKHIQDSA